MVTLSDTWGLSKTTAFSFIEDEALSRGAAGLSVRAKARPIASGIRPSAGTVDFVLARVNAPLVTSKGLVHELDVALVDRDPRRGGA
jgi:hypothetical protein